MNSLNNGKFNLSHKTSAEDFELLTQALDASICGIIITDSRLPDNPIIYCNKAFETITGYSREEIIGHNCRFLQKDDRNQKERLVLRDAVQHGKECIVDIRNYRKDGTLFYNELYMSPIKDEAGGISYFIGVQNDVTKRKNAEMELRHQQDVMESRIVERTQSLKQSEDYLASIVQTVRESLLVLGSDYIVLSANEHFFKTFKVTREDTHGKLLYSFRKRAMEHTGVKRIVGEYTADQ